MPTHIPQQARQAFTAQQGKSLQRNAHRRQTDQQRHQPVAAALGDGDWEQRDAVERAALLGPYASGDAVLPASDQEGNERLDAVFKALADARTRHGTDALGTYIISMAHSRADVLTVPLDAVRTDKPAPYLQTLKDGRVVYAPVKTGTRAVVGGQTLVAVEGVPEGTVVIAGRIGLLREGTAVAVAASAATAAAAPALAAASRAAP